MLLANPLALLFLPAALFFYEFQKIFFTTERAIVSERRLHTDFALVVRPPSLPVRAQNTDVLLQEQ